MGTSSSLKPLMDNCVLFDLSELEFVSQITLEIFEFVYHLVGSDLIVKSKNGLTCLVISIAKSGSFVKCPNLRDF